MIGEPEPGGAPATRSASLAASSSQRTRRLVGGLFEVGEPRCAPSQGLRRAAAQAGGWSAKASPRAALRRCVSPSLTPLVGRDTSSAAARALGRRQGRRRPGGPALGRAGHRQVAASRARCAAAGRRGLSALSHYCSPYHTNSALYPVIGLLERAAGSSRKPPDASSTSWRRSARSTDQVEEVAPDCRPARDSDR